MRLRSLIFLLAVSVSACTQQIAIQGEGDVTSASGERNCSLEDAPCNFAVIGDYSDSYTALPREGWQFGAWGICLFPNGNICTNTVPASAVNKNWFRTYTTTALFEPAGLDGLNSTDISQLEAIAGSYSQERHCTLRGLAGSSNDASAAINSCIEAAPANTVLTFPPGKFMVASKITIDKALYLKTAGKMISDPGCSLENNLSCTEFIATEDLFPTATRGLLDIASNNVTLGHLVINGSKATRSTSAAGQACASGNNTHGFNITVFASNFTLYSSITRDSLCATGLAVNAGVGGILIVNNVAAYNGVHGQIGLWADGITIADVRDAVVSRNMLIDNTDIDLIFGGCQNCEIQENLIEHSDAFETSAFAALMLHAWPTSSGDYTGSVTSNNVINCTNKRCGFGLYLGSLSWYVAPMFGGIVENNTIDNAMLGFNVEESTASVKVTDNFVSNSGGTHNTSCGNREMGAYNISAGSIVDRSDDTVPDESYTQLSYAGCIPNFFETNPDAVCDPVSQTFPSWDEVDGVCLPSCGAAGGTVASGVPCADAGLIDVGPVYDVLYCCM